MTKASKAGVEAEVPLARTIVNDLMDAGLMDDVLARIDAQDVRLTGEGGFLPEMIKAVWERGLQVERDDRASGL